MPTLSQTDYAGWANCHKLANGRIELIITGDVGPRLIRFGFVGGENMLFEDPAGVGRTGGDEWRLYGGHRLWHAPEHPVRTYLPDNAPVQVEDYVGGARVTQPVEAANGIHKQIDIVMDENAAHVQLTHRLINTGPWPVMLSAWALSVMAGGGTAIIPLPPRGEHPRDLLPTTQLAIWPYTDMADPRWTWGTRHILLRQRDAAPQKVGLSVPDGWVGYANFGNLFVKRFQPITDAIYPDLNSSVEVFTNNAMLEVETLSPLTQLAPGAAVEHVEHWHLFEGVTAPQNDADVERDILPKLV
jgi:hypothetical protein